MATRYQVKVTAWLQVDADSETEATQFTFATEEVIRMLDEQGQDFDINDPLEACSRCGETLDALDECNTSIGEPAYCSEECENLGPAEIGASR